MTVLEELVLLKRIHEELNSIGTEVYKLNKTLEKIAERMAFG